MGKVPQAAAENPPRSAATTARILNWERLGILYARIALGAAFLSGIASRFGLYGRNVGYGNFANFVSYTAKVNSFMPTFTIPFLAWAATTAELFLGITLILGVWQRWVALGSANAIGVVRYSDGHLLRDQVSARLLGVFRVGNRGIACALADQEIWYKLMKLTPKLAPVRLSGRENASHHPSYRRLIGFASEADRIGLGLRGRRARTTRYERLQARPRPHERLLGKKAASRTPVGKHQAKAEYNRYKLVEQKSPAREKKQP